MNLSKVIGNIRSTSQDNVVTIQLEGNKHDFLQKNICSGARTAELTPDEKYLLVACKSSQRLFVLGTNKLNDIDSIKTDPYPVGLAVSNDGSHVVTTSQGSNGKGGNAVSIFELHL